LVASWFEKYGLQYMFLMQIQCRFWICNFQKLNTKSWGQ
jgi:hypothetical protein